MPVTVAFIPFVFMLVLWRRRIRDFRDRFLTAAIVWGAMAIAITELLSQFNHISFRWLLAAWCAGAFAVVAATPLIPRSPPKEKVASPKWDGWIWLMVAAVFAIVSVSGLVAWIGPPNNWDSLTYHMTRVVHWIQNRNVAFYPTVAPSQLELMPGAEYIILNLQLLCGGDRMANLVQWFAFVGCIVGASSIARLWGADVRGQVLAAVFTATLPSACLEAVTTQNDLVVAFWLVCFIWLTLRVYRQGAGGFDLCLCGLSAGLALVTKATSYIFIAPFVLALIGIAAGKYKWRAVAPLLVAAVLAILPSLPMYARNYRFTHTLLGTHNDPEPYSNTYFGCAPTVCNIVRNIALEMTLPWNSARTVDVKTARAILHLLGLNPSDPASTWQYMDFDAANFTNLRWNSEDTAGNPAHLVLFCGVLITVLIGFRRARIPFLLYSAGVVLGFVGFCVYLRWQLYHTRLLVPLLILCGPMVGVAMERWWKACAVSGIACCLLVAAMVCIVSNRRHPFYGREGIFTADRTSRYFMDRPGLEAPCRALAERAVELHCREVGLILTNRDFEYPFDVLLKGADPSIRIEAFPQAGLLDPHTRNQGWRDDLRPAMVVKIEGDSATEVELK
jgi:hypothetical protein